ncbi:MAG: hypothetical protein ACRCZI_12450 [Cetobacterium sp.]
MFDGGFTTYGYDQVVVNPAAGNYVDYSDSIIQKPDQTAKYFNPSTSYIYSANKHEFTRGRDFDEHGYHQPMNIPRYSSTRKQLVPGYDDVYDYMEKSVRSTVGQQLKEHEADLEIELLRKKLTEFQHKHDILMIIIICLIIYIVLHISNVHDKRSYFTPPGSPPGYASFSAPSVAVVQPVVSPVMQSVPTV